MYRPVKTTGCKLSESLSRWCKLSILAFTLYILLAPVCLWAAPFAEYVQFTQPDGVHLTLWGEGDEFHAIFETTKGYTVIFDPTQRAYFYAQRAADGKSLISSGVLAHNPVPPGLAKHIRMDQDAVNAAARARQKKWNKETGLTERWSRLKSQTLGRPLAAAEDGALPAPPEIPTLGSKVGLTLLIDFVDAPASISQTEIDAYLNSDSYTGFGNNGSVKQYFSDVSGNRLTYTNVVTIYVRMAQPKSYYNDTSKDTGLQGRLLINDALDILKARSDYNSTILPTFNSLTTDESGNVVAFNVFFAGTRSGAWGYGLWPHSWVLAGPVPLGNGKSVYRYQITNIGTSLYLGTFAHENGHMLCGFPDLYDYDRNSSDTDYESKGGAGVFSLMGYGGYGTNPVQVDAYLKLAAGWVTVTDLDSNSNLTGLLVAAPESGYDHIYRYQRPGVATEYYLFENRQNTGRDAYLPAAGIAVWHVDELGDRDNQSMVPNSLHLNYELTLVQADNLWHFQNNVNAGDAFDLYYQGNSAASYTNRLDDTSTPHAHWWDGTASFIDLNGFSAAGPTMIFNIGTGDSGIPAPVLAEEPPVTSGTSNTIYWSDVSATLGIAAAEDTLGSIMGISSDKTDKALKASQLTLQAVSETPVRVEELRGDDFIATAQATLDLESVIIPQDEGAKELHSSVTPLPGTTLFNETFEGVFPGSSWILSGTPTWDDTSYDKHGGNWSGWCGDSTLDPVNGYVDDMIAWMVHGPFSLADAATASMSFWYRNLSEIGYDYFNWMASVDGENFSGYKISGDQNSWRSEVLDLTNVPFIGDLRGEPQVWIAFVFTSDDSVSGPVYTGAFVDDIIITKESSSGPDLNIYKPPNWNDNIPVGIAELSWDAEHSYTGPYNDDQILFFNWGALNQGNETASGYTVHVEVTGTGGGSFDWSGPALDPGYFTYLLNDQGVGPLAAGSHTFKVWVDYTDAVAESNEGNNYYERTIIVLPRMEYYAESADNPNFNSSISSGWIMPTQWTFSNLTPGQNYWYRVKARRGTDESSWSNIEQSLQEPLHVSVVANGSGNGSGMITGDLAGDLIDAVWNGDALSGDNSALVDKGSGPYILSAAASTGSTVSWTEGCDSTAGNGTVTATCTLNAPVTSNKNVTATFDCSSVFYIDSDGDGFGNPDDFIIACEPPVGYVTNNEDCNDSNPIIPMSGDINADGNVYIDDAIIALQIVAGYSSVGNICKAADINEDGRIGTHEAIYILQIISRLKPHPGEEGAQ